MHRSLKRKLVLVLAALAAAAFAGGAYAATQTSAPNVRQAFVNDVAHRLNVTPAKLRAAIKGAYLDQLNTAVASGRLTRAQAGALREWVRRNGAIPFGALLGPRAGLARPAPLGLVPRFFAPAGRLPGAPLAVAPLRRAILFGGLLSSAHYLGLTPMQLLAQLRSGKSLAQIATAQRKSAAGLKAALVARAQQMIDRLVAAKWITPARGKELLARLSAKIDKLINRTNLRLFPFAAPMRPGFAHPLPVP